MPKILAYSSGLQLKPSKKVWGKEGIIQQEMKELKLPEEDFKPVPEKISNANTSKDTEAVCGIFYCKFHLD